MLQDSFTPASQLFRGGDLVEQVVQLMRQRIVGEHYPDGQLPSQGKLCQEIGVSRPVIREAMSKLESMGLIELSQGKLPRVRQVDAHAASESLGLLLERTAGDLRHVLEARRALETHITALAAERATESDIRELRAEVERQAGAVTLEQQVETDRAFHRRLARATGNPVFVVLLDTIAQLLLNSLRRSVGRVGVKPAVADHRKIVEAVAHRDAQAAQQAMREHLKHAERDLELHAPAL